MTFKLPTLAEMDAQLRGKPQLKGASRVEMKDDDRAIDKEKLDKFKQVVWLRDKGRCRKCGVKVLKTLTLTAKRGEVNHVAGRSDRAVRYDPRNGILLCNSPCHEQVTGAVNVKVVIVGTVFFEVSGTRYINAAKPVTFKVAA
jgi:hypothetical protein